MKRIALFVITNLAVMLVLGLVVNLFGLNVEWLRMKREEAAVRQSMTQTFKAAYPNEAILDPVAQMRKNLEAAKASTGPLVEKRLRQHHRIQIGARSRRCVDQAFEGAVRLDQLEQRALATPLLIEVDLNHGERIFAAGRRRGVRPGRRARRAGPLCRARTARTPWPARRRTTGRSRRASSR